MSKYTRFVVACNQVLLEYYNTGEVRDTDKFKKGIYVTLKSPYSTIAANILPTHRRPSGRLFFKDHAVRACIIADIFVIDVISSYK